MDIMVFYVIYTLVKLLLHFKFYIRHKIGASLTLTTKLGRNVYVTSYCDRLWRATCNIFGFLDLAIKYLKIATLQRSLTCQMSMLNSLEKVNSAFWTYMKKDAPGKNIVSAFSLKAYLENQTLYSFGNTSIFKIQCFTTRVEFIFLQYFFYHSLNHLQTNRLS